MSEFYADDEDDQLIEGPEPEPMNNEEVALITTFKELVQKVKASIYNKTVRQTTNSEDLKELQKYEVMIYSIGTQLLKSLYEIETQPLPKELAEIVNRKDLSSDARILLENEVRNQFIQFPYSRKINNGNY
jgi:hypothetical protein